MRPSPYAAAIAAATFLMGSSFVAGKILLLQVPPFALGGWRFLAAAAGALLFALANRQALLPRIGLRAWLAVGAIGLLQTGGMVGFLFLALRTISAPNGAVLLLTNPLWVGVLAPLLLREPVSWRRRAALVLGFAGTAVIVGWQADADPVGIGYGLLSALSWSGSTLIHRRIRVPMGFWSLSFWQMLVGSLAVLAVSVASGEHWPAAALGWQGWAWFAWLALPASVGSFGLWFYALEHGGGSARSSGFLYLAPLFTTLLSWPILGRVPLWTDAAGAALILGSILVARREGA